MPGPGARYDAIGAGYAARRRPDARIKERVHAALGDARSVVNVGAGTGNYEPTDRPVVAIEPSVVMAAQRPPHLPPAVLAPAEDLPLADDSADAVLASVTVHHWRDPAAGIAEALRVARRRVVILTIDPIIEAGMWLFADYLPDVVAQDLAEFPSLDTLLGWLGPGARSEVVPVPADCTDGFLLSFWSAPERVLDADARRATSGFSRLDDAREAEVVAQVGEDLRSGAWDARHGAIRTLDAYDAGMRLVIAELA